MQKPWARWREIVRQLAGPVQGLPPLDDSEIATDQERRARYLLLLNRAWLIFGVLSLLGMPLYPSERTLGFAIFLITATTYPAVRALRRSGRIQAGAIVFCASVDALFLTLFIILGLQDGFTTAFNTQATVLMSMSLAVLVAGSLLGPRAAFIVALFNSVLVVALRLTLAPTTPPRGSLIVFAWLIALIAWLYERTLARAFGRLRGIRGELEDLVSARTARLAQTVAELQEMSARLETANRQLESYSYSVAHDLRGPVQAILISAEALRRDPGVAWTETAQEDLQQVLDGAHRMTTMISELLQLARSEQETLQRQTVRLDEIAREVFNGLPESAQVVEATIEPIPPVQAHPGLIRQVLVNLITNALKFTRGRPLARITIGSERRNGELACFVSDNGVGFGPGEADRLFGMFYQARGRERHEGTGIGLAIVKSIVEHHGGRVWAEGEEGVGATFYFTLGGAA